MLLVIIMSKKNKQPRKSQARSLENSLRVFGIHEKSVAVKINSRTSVIQRERNSTHTLVRNAKQYIRTVVHPDLYEQVLDWYQSAFRLPIDEVAIKVQKSIELLSPDTAFGALPLRSELFWAATMLSKRVEHLIKFLNLSSSFSDAIMSGDKALAEELLVKVELITGQSFWLIEAKLAFLQFEYGLEQQKAYANTFQESAPASFAAFVAHYISQRNEESVSPTRMSTAFRQKLDSWSMASDLRDYVEYRVIGDLPTSRTSLANILVIEGEMSIIDLLDTFFRIATVLSVEGDDTDKNLIATILTKFPKLPDIRFSVLAQVVGCSYVPLPPAKTELILATNAYLSGQISIARDILNGYLLSYPSDVLGLFEAARVGVYFDPLKPSNLQETMLQLMTDTFRRDIELNLALSKLDKLSRNFRFLNIGLPLQALVQQFDFINPKKHKQLETMLFIATPAIHPSHAIGLNGENRSIFINKCSEHFTQCSTLEFAQITIGQKPLGSNLSIDNYIWAQYHFALQKSDKKEIINCLNQLSQSSDSISKRAAISEKILALSVMQQLEEAIKLIATTIVSDPLCQRSLPLQAVFAEKTYSQLEVFRFEPYVHIGLMAYFQQSDDKDAFDSLRSLWDEFIDSRGIFDLSDLEYYCEQFSKEVTIYFLRYVCIEDVMDISTLFSTSIEVSIQRSKICERLMDLDPENAPEYRQEIVETSKQMKVLEGLQHFDQSRVYVNGEALFRWGNRELIEPFDRYTRLIEAGLGGSEEEFEEAIKQYTNTGNVLPKKFLEIPTTESIALLLEMIDRFWSEYRYHPLHGLDSYLSLRIRHGSLSGHLRGPFEQDKLLITEDESEESLNKLRLWFDEEAEISELKITEIIQIFKKFSDSFQKIISRLNHDLLQIRSDIKPNGLFLNTIQENYLRYIKKKTDQPPNLEEFLTACSIVFELVIREAMTHIRTELTENTMLAVEQCVGCFKDSLNNILTENEFSSLRAAISHRFTDFQTAITQVSEWFKGDVRAFAAVSFTFDEILDVAVDVIRRTHRGRNFELIRKIDIEERQGMDVLQEVVDILFIVFANALTHSKISDNLCIEILASKVESNHTLKIRISNNVSPDVKTPDCIEKLNSIRMSIESEEYLGHTHLEGGTGLKKLKKIASAHQNHNLSYGFGDENTFFVDLELAMLSTPVAPVEIPNIEV